MAKRGDRILVQVAGTLAGFADKQELLKTQKRRA
jgi:hypothetical protein